MKIRPDQIEGVRPDQQSKADKARKSQNAFDEVLTGEVAKTAKPQGVAPVAPPPGMHPLQGVASVETAQPVAPVSKDTGQTISKVEDALGQLETYAASLQDAGPDGTGLKQAYQALNGLTDGVEDLKEMSREHPGLREMVNELEVLARTEQIKFNRGDYT